jgi:hypothetical protein
LIFILIFSIDHIDSQNLEVLLSFRQCFSNADEKSYAFKVISDLVDGRPEGNADPSMAPTLKKLVEKNIIGLNKGIPCWNRRICQIVLKQELQRQKRWWKFW